MRSDRIARTLLRLYPLEWRERYGDEFVALVSESSLTWGAAVDIVFAAAVERVRRLTALARAEMTVPTPLPPMGTMTGAEILFTQLGSAALGAPLIVMLAQLGIAAPEGFFFWLQPFITMLYFDSLGRVTRATIGERIVLTFAWFLVAVSICAAALLVGDVLRSLGVPLPSDRVFLLMLATIFASAVARVSYRRIASSRSTPRPAINLREIWVWSAAYFAILVMVRMAEPTHTTFWFHAGCWSTWIAFVRTRHVFAARRRAWRAQQGS